MGWTSARTWVSGELITASIMNTYIRDNQNVLKTPINDSGQIEFTDVGTALTIASGVITVTQNYHMVDTQSDGASDDLDTITAGTDVAAGFVLTLRVESGARTVVLKNATAGAANLDLGADVSLDETWKTFSLIYDGSNWRPLTIDATLTIGGTDTQVQFNNSGVLGGDSGLVFNSGTDVLTAGKVATTDTSATSLTSAGGITAGTGSVALVGTDGKLSGPLSSTIIDDLSGADLTTLNASNISSGTLAAARLPAKIAVTSSDADALDVTGGLTIGSGDVPLVGTDGKLSGPLSSTIIDDLDGSNLTDLAAGAIATGTVGTARLGSGVADASTFLRGDSSWASAGGSYKILQVHNFSYTAQVGSTTNVMATTNITDTITLADADNKCLVMVTVGGVSKSGATGVSIRVQRAIAGGATTTVNAGNIEHSMSYTASTATNYAGSAAFNFLDDPTTTSALTYTVEFSNASNVSNAYVMVGNGRGTITLMEVEV